MEDIKHIVGDLDVDVSKIITLVNENGLYGAARILGFDITHYNNLLVAGKLAIASLKQKSPQPSFESEFSI